ncbi:MAG: FG-GAP-like repeat-containing protein [Kiritimatiellia bacterium]
MRKLIWICGAATCGALWAGDRDAALRAAQAKERAGQTAEAVQEYGGVYADAQAPGHQRLAALCGLLRTDAARRLEWSRAGLGSPDELWSGTVAQALALLPPEAIDAARATWIKELPPASLLKVLRAVVHVKSPAAKAFLVDALGKSPDAAIRQAALEGTGRVGTAEDVPLLLIWMGGADAAAAEAARRGLILLGDAKTDAVLAGRLKSYESNPAFLARLLDVLAVRNALGQAAQIVPYLCHADEGVRIQAFRALGQQGQYAEQAAVLAAAMKAKGEKERREARKAVAKIARRAGGVQFKARRIGNCRTEACGVADFNNDGRPDVVAGPFLYLAPEFRPQKVREVKSDVTEDGKGYAHDFMNLPLDVNADGRLDVVSGNWFTKETWWFQNTLPGADLWPTHVIEQTGNIETGILVDLDGDGRATDFLPDTQLTCLYQLGKGGALGGFFARDSISNERCDMGRGCGDLNGDGRNDILTPAYWYERCADDSWKRHPYDVGFSDGGRALGHASNLIVFDVNKDGLNDVIVSSAHKYGIFWYEQLKERDAAGEIQFRKHVIDDSWTQAHYLGWGDIDGDGVPELITGKRFMAHNGNDPDEYGRLGIYYYDFTPGADPVFRKYVISFDAGISVGLNVECVDLDGDGDLDLVTTGKWGGPVILENKTK